MPRLALHRHACAIGAQIAGEISGVVDGEEFIADRNGRFWICVRIGDVERVHRTHVSPDCVEDFSHLMCVLS